MKLDTTATARTAYRLSRLYGGLVKILRHLDGADVAASGYPDDRTIAKFHDGNRTLYFVWAPNHFDDGLEVVENHEAEPAPDSYLRHLWDHHHPEDALEKLQERAYADGSRG